SRSGAEGRLFGASETPPPGLVVPPARRQTVLGEYLTSPAVSPVRKYQDVVVGDRRWWSLVRFELLTTLLGELPGVAGLGLRRLLYPSLLGASGANVVFGKGLTLRHPGLIRLGANVVIDDHCVLDAKGGGAGAGRPAGIAIGSGVFVGRSTVLSCKGGSIEVGDHANLGLGCVVLSESQVSIGESCLFAAHCYLVAGGNHDFSRTDIPIIQQPSVSRGGIRIEPNVWLGARVTVIDGVTIGRDAVVGAGAVVTRDVPPFAVVAGVPAKVVRMRTDAGGDRR
ncbi:MAG: acyltransferase, partial [Candidatus Rokuibacteriota bacterium]